MAGSSDQRTTRRFALKLPLSVRTANGSSAEVAAETEDVSSRGVYFYLEGEVQEGSVIEFTLTLPQEITLTQGIRVKCTGRVIRVDGAGMAGQVGIAAAIEKYDFLSE